jgi:hypothetical protein
MRLFYRQLQSKATPAVIHAKAKKAYAWSHPEGKDDTGERFVAVLEIPPVESPVTAVRASIVADSKKRKKG